MNAVREMYSNKKIKKEVKKPDLKVVKNESKEANYSKEDLNEKMYYFYNNGGPVMDI